MWSAIYIDECINDSVFIKITKSLLKSKILNDYSYAPISYSFKHFADIYYKNKYPKFLEKYKPCISITQAFFKLIVDDICEIYSNDYSEELLKTVCTNYYITCDIQEFITQIIETAIEKIKNNF